MGSLGRCLLAIALGLLIGTASLAQTTSSTTKRTPQQIQEDVSAAARELRQIAPSPASIVDPQTRAQVAPQAIPLLRRILTGLEELGEYNPRMQAQAGEARPQLLALLAALGDEPAKAQLESLAGGADAPQATAARAALLQARWIQASQDAAAQEKILEEANALAAEQPQSDPLSMALMQMSQLGAANDDLRDEARRILMEMKSPMAQQMAEQMQADKKLQSLENKPLVIEGLALDGTRFSTEQWKGKVILVDFWATWCGPCIHELPRVKKAYAQWHDQGLEVLGVSCDQSADDLKEFLQKNPDMPWPQLFDPASPGWHPLAKAYGIQGIPTMFLIDKKGVVRTVEARRNFEELIPKLLAE